MKTIRRTTRKLTPRARRTIIISSSGSNRTRTSSMIRLRRLTCLRKCARMPCLCVPSSWVLTGVFQQFIGRRTAAILCRLHPLLCGAVRRGQHRLGNRTYGRDDPAPALKSDSDCRRAAIRKDAVRAKRVAEFADRLPCRRGGEMELTARTGRQSGEASVHGGVQGEEARRAGE